MMYLWIILLVAAIAIVWYFTMRSGDGLPLSTPREKDPLDILRERFARGEIDQDEYEKRKRMLEPEQQSDDDVRDEDLV